MKNLTKTFATVLLVLLSYAYAEPNLIKHDNCPCPEGGMETLLASIEFPNFPNLPHWETFVTLSFRVNPDGSATHFLVLESGGEIYDEAAISACASVHWKPATIDGQPVPVRFNLPFRFHRP